MVVFFHNEVYQLRTEIGIFCVRYPNVTYNITTPEDILNEMTGILSEKSKMTMSDPLIGQQLGDYKIVDVVGRGGMGRVYKGHDEKLQRYSAVKVFDAEGVVGDDLDEYRERFQREARAVARLRHPNIVDLYQFGQSGSLYYMAMTMVEGRDLRTVLKEYATAGKRASHEEIVRIMTDVASALDYAHAEGVIHRDVKPSNIMIMADGHAMLTDFGLALNVPEGTIGSTFGSVHYIAPEQAMNSAMAVPQSDLYSLGIVLYEMLAGKVPFDDQSAMSVALRHLSDPPPPLRKHNPDIKPEVESMVLRTLDKDPERRYPTGEAFVRALENALGLTDEDDETRRVIIPDWAKDRVKLAEEAPVEQPKIPAPVIASSSAETITERSTPAAPKIEPPAKKPEPIIAPLQKAKPSVPPAALIASGIGVMAVGIVILLALSGSGNSSGGTTATPEAPTEADVAVVAITDKPTEVPTDVPTEQPTRAPTQRPSVTTEPAATRTPAPTGMVIVGDNHVRLIYDSESLVLLNDSTEPVNIRDLIFSQPVAEGRPLEFPTQRWDGGSAPLEAVPPGDCFQVYTTNVVVGDTPSMCMVRHKWDQASAPRWFWISDDPDALFEVRRGETILGECRVGDGECVVDVG